MTIIRASDTTDPRLKVYTELTNHQLRNSLDSTRGIAIVESQIAIRVALGHGVEPLSLLLDERRVKAMADVLEALPSDVPVFVLPPEEARRLTGYRVTRGALCAVRRPARPQMASLLDGAQRVVVLEGITDTSNVGAVFRNAAALGADAVIVAPSCADPLSRRAIRVSMGNVFLVGWTYAEVPWPQCLLSELEERGFARIALALDEGASSLRGMRGRVGERVALFFGAEGSGLSDAVVGGCDRTVVIPMANDVDSLNVAASTAVAMWELFGA